MAFAKECQPVVENWLLNGEGVKGEKSLRNNGSSESAAFEKAV